MGRKHYGDAVNCYTRAIDQKVLGDADTSVLFANRAHVNLLLGNYRRALEDAERAIQLSPGNVKVQPSWSPLFILNFLVTVQSARTYQFFVR